MKCATCHTNLPEFGRFEKKVCPNCGAAAVQPQQQKKQMPFLVYIYLVLFTLCALIMLFMLIFSISKTLYFHNNREDFIKTEAVISKITEQKDSDGDVDHDVYINFTFDGVEYEDVRYSQYSSTMHVGDSLFVEVDPADPDNLPEDLTVAAIVFGLAFILMSALLWLMAIKPLQAAKEKPVL